MNGKRQRSAVDRCLSPGINTPWSIASLRPAPPLYTLKTFGKITYAYNNFLFFLFFSPHKCPRENLRDKMSRLCYSL